jgi:uncharacterized protein (TIGR00661 family)
MRILYGVTGEGMGHATRSRVVIDHLMRSGHNVTIVAYGKALEYLSKYFRVLPITGLHIQYDNGAMSLFGSIALNAAVLPQNLAANAAVYQQVTDFRPEIVFTDFEPFSYLWGTTNNVPVVSIDNPQMIHRCVHGSEIINGDQQSFRTADAFVALTEPRCSLYVITTFFYPSVKEAYLSNTLLVPPILRDSILRARPSNGDHVLVYQTSISDQLLLNVLRSIPQQRFIVYGLPTREDIPGNCLLKSFQEDQFVQDLASAKAVIANGGMSLIGEALALGKPIYSVPVRDHFEQIMNARYLQKLGYGMTSEYFDGKTLKEFLVNLQYFSSRIRSVPQQDGNQRLFSIVDSVVSG